MKCLRLLILLIAFCSMAGFAQAASKDELDAEVREAAGRRGLTVICSGSHPFSLPGEQRISPSERYDQLVDEMAAADVVKAVELRDTVLLGELGLDGRVRPVRGVLPATLAAAQAGFRRAQLNGADPYLR